MDKNLWCHRNKLENIWFGSLCVSISGKRKFALLWNPEHATGCLLDCSNANRSKAKANITSADYTTDM